MKVAIFATKGYGEVDAETICRLAAGGTRSIAETSRGNLTQFAQSGRCDNAVTWPQVRGDSS